MASREKLEEIMANAEIGPALNMAAGSAWSGWLANQALNYYKKIKINNLKKISDIDLHNQFNRHLDLGFPTAWYNPFEAKNKFDLVLDTYQLTERYIFNTQ